jgi:excisionase family DNA binding protein
MQTKQLVIVLLTKQPICPCFGMVSNFFKRFPADGLLPEQASRGLYEAKMRSAGNYSDEDM